MKPFNLSQHLRRSAVNVEDWPYNAKGDGTADDAAAIIGAIAAVGAAGGTVFFPAGNFKIGSSLGIIPANVHLVGAGKGATTITKAFNGDVATLGLNCTVSRLSVNGQGASYTGRGFIIATGSPAGTGYQKIEESSIYAMAGYCVEWTADSAGWGGGIFNCDVQRTGNVGPCLKMPTAETNGTRMLVSVFAGSGPLIDFAGAINVLAIGCMSGSGAGPSPAFLMSPASAKIQIIGGRFGTGGGTTTLLGQNQIFVGNSHAGPFNYGSGAADSLVNSTARGNDFGGFAVAYQANPTLSGNANDIDLPYNTYVCAWTSSGTAPALGNGSINATYFKVGRVVTVTIAFTAGSTTTFGTGAWNFALPVKAAVSKAIGTASMIDSSAGAHFIGASRIEESATSVQVYPDQANIVTNAGPFPWAVGDTLVLTLSYFAL